MNKTLFLARTTKDIEVRYTQSNKAVGRFSIAVDTGYGDNKKTNFFNCIAWEKTAETLEKYAPKGTKLLLECEAVQNQYEDKNGNKVNTVEFVVKNFEFCESKKDSQGDAQPAPAPRHTDSDGFMNLDGLQEMDELPFE